MARSKVKLRSNCDFEQPHLLANVPTKYQHPTSFGVLRYGPDKIFEVKVTKARSNQGHTVMLHTYTP